MSVKYICTVLHFFVNGCGTLIKKVYCDDITASLVLVVVKKFQLLSMNLEYFTTIFF